MAAFTLPPLGSALSSAADERHVIPKDTFAMTGELELRQMRIDSLVSQCPGLFCLVSPPSLGPLNPPAQARLRPILKRALRQCDRLADIAADESPLAPQCYPDICNIKWVTDAISTPANSTPADIETINPLANPKARPKQIEYIRSLSLEDAAGLFVLVNMIGHAVTTIHPYYYLGTEARTCAEECVLRHGTWFVWAWLRRDRNYLPELVDCIILAGRDELLRALLGGVSGDEFNQKLEKTLRTFLIDKGEDKKVDKLDVSKQKSVRTKQDTA